MHLLEADVLELDETTINQISRDDPQSIAEVLLLLYRNIVLNKISVSKSKKLKHCVEKYRKNPRKFEIFQTVEKNTGGKK